MRIKRLELRNFRNYLELEHKFSQEKVEVYYGENGQGKSNILEAIEYLATLRDSRLGREEELINWSLGEMHMVAEIETKEGEEELMVNMVRDLEGLNGRVKKKLRVNGVARRGIDFVGRLKSVSFIPEDLNMVRGRPSIRREEMDRVMVQADRKFRVTLSDFEKVLIARNRLLKNIKEGLGGRESLWVWEARMVELGEIIYEKRQEFIGEINGLLGELGKYKLKYIPNRSNVERLEEVREREMGAGQSLVGPQRDDLEFYLEAREMGKFGSRGEQRSGVFDLKAAEVSWIDKRGGERPILLLDDVFSELDERHREHIWKLSSGQQTIITTVELEREIYGRKGIKVYEVKAGSLSSTFGTGKTGANAGELVGDKDRKKGD